MAAMLSLDRMVTEGTQARVSLSQTVIREYAEAMTEGETFPPIDLYFDETTYWLADGFHRVAAAKVAGLLAMAATVHPGGQREALLHALGANETHGHRRTDADRRHAVELLLADPEWRAWSDREIARQCHVSHMLINRVRRARAARANTRARTNTAGNTWRHGLRHPYGEHWRSEKKGGRHTATSCSRRDRTSRSGRRTAVTSNVWRIHRDAICHSVTDRRCHIRSGGKPRADGHACGAIARRGKANASGLCSASADGRHSASRAPRITCSAIGILVRTCTTDRRNSNACSPRATFPHGRLATVG